MSVMPNTVCRRCHRQFASYKSRCPYCGTKKSRDIRRSVPVSDSAVRGTTAARRAAEDIQWQTLIGGALLVCVIAAVIAVISVNMRARVDETEQLTSALAQQEAAAREVAAETTAIPIPTASPTPSPSPTPGITSIEITSPVWAGGSREGFMEGYGTTVDLDATAYPITENVEITWSSTDESVATVDQTGLVTVVGSTGQICDIIASAGDVSAKCTVWVA